MHSYLTAAVIALTSANAGGILNWSFQDWGDFCPWRSTGEDRTVLHPPDPRQARTIDDFIVALRLLKLWSGNPSITQIARDVCRLWRAAGRPDTELPARSTVGNCFLTGRRRPNLDLLAAVINVLADDENTATQWIGVFAHNHAGRAGLGTRENRPPDPG